jgi:magnesium chelatase accessory protein
LPGHAFTAGGSWQARSLDGMGRALNALLAEMDVQPAAIVGHSAGVAIALHLGGIPERPIPVIGYNPALMPFEGLGEQLFPAMAKLLLLNPLAPRLFAGMARIPGEAERFLKRATNSQIDEHGLACYSKLVGNSRHCQGALTMMASWDLSAFSERLPGFAQAVHLIHGGADNAVPLSSAQNAARLLPNCTLEVLDGLGHLAHEERPEDAAARIAAFVRDHALDPAK